MYKKGLCSICCLGYAHAPFLEQNIRAIWSGDYKNVEIIAVDDGSPDDSAAILKRLAQESPMPMTVIAQQNTGNVGKNFNIALAKARGEYITFMSLDDVLMPDALSYKIAFMEKDPHLAFVASSKVIRIDTNGKISSDCTVPDLKLFSMQNPTIDDLLNLEYDETGSFYIQGNVFRKEIVDAVGGFDEDMTGDDIILRTKIFLYLKDHHSYSFQIIKKPSCYYRKHENNLHKNLPRQIKIVSEHQERYFPNRKNSQELIRWTKSVIKKMPYEEYIKVFSMNARAASLLQESEIQKSIKQSILLAWIDFIFKKKKFQNGLREITLFSLFTFSYHKKKRRI
jgi:alpha-1,3-rhamnosyltransferase